MWTKAQAILFLPEPAVSLARERIGDQNRQERAHKTNNIGHGPLTRADKFL
jgi:hypothetical protein